MLIVAGNEKSQWFKKNAIGINKLSGLVKSMKMASGIQNDRRLTNYRY